MMIKKVWCRRKSGQKLVTIPIRSTIKEGDYVRIEKVEDTQIETKPEPTKEHTQEVPAQEVSHEEPEVEKIKSAQETIKHVTLQQEANKIAESIEEKKEPIVKPKEEPKPEPIKEESQFDDVALEMQAIKEREKRDREYEDKG